MIDVKYTPQSNQIEVRFSGQVTQSDYQTVLVPAFERALSDHDDLRILAILDDGFTGFDLGAAWADTKLGLSHWRGFDRAAVATDSGWIGSATRAMAPMLPCPVKVFPIAETEAARRWLRESLGSIHVTELGGPAIQLSLLGKIDPESYARAGEALDAHMRKHDGLRLLLDLREFDGWQGLSAIGAHLHIARTHIGMTQRIAMVGDKAWQHLAQRAARHIIRADTKYFEAAQFDAAKAWLIADVV